MRMLKCLLLVLLCCLTGNAAAAQMPSKYEGCLYPVRADGLWGYIDYIGRMVIEPQWYWCGAFRGQGFAAVEIEDDTVNPYTCGIIDQSGKYVIEAVYITDEGYSGGYYGGKDTGITWISNVDGESGFFDNASGFFSGFQWGEDVPPWVGEDRLILVTAKGGDYKSNGGYADRATGELVIPYQYDNVSSQQFQEGFAWVEKHNPETGEATGFIFDVTGTPLNLPGRVLPIEQGCFQEGRLRVVDEATGLYGFADAAGMLVIAPQFEDANDFNGGYASVKVNGLWGHIDRNGQWVCKPRFVCNEGYTFINDRAVVQLENACGVINAKGDLLFQLDGGQYTIWDFFHDGLTLYEDGSGESGLQHVGFIDDDGHIVLDAKEGYCYDESYKYDYADIFPEGLQVLVKDGKYGFIDTVGRLVIPFEWDNAVNFSNGLAYVEKEGKMRYIDRNGNIVWQEK